MSEQLPSGAGPADGGVIHNIGYRSYQGPRLGRGYATRSLYVQSLRAAYGLGRSGKSKVLPMLVASGLTAAAVVIVAIGLFLQGPVKTDLFPVDYPQFLSAFGVLVQIFVAAQSPVLMSRDLRHHTVPLYFSRPITRGDYVRAKFAAMTSAMLLMTVVPLLVLYLGSILGGLPLGKNTGHFLQGLAVAVVTSLVYAALGLAISALTPRRGFGVAAIMGVLLVSSVLAGIVYLLLGGDRMDPPESAHWAFLLSPSSATEALLNQVLDIRTAGQLTAPDGIGVVVFALAVVAMIGGSYWALLRRYRKI
ncbi:ABC transporter permease [Kitasatospora sp. NPDC051853]|uniref:ABC transporter permease n=1 Tax=Kitasatospora sp. NPDC051853 TaxID=3364058 RepID=UPI0037A41CBE